MVKGAFKQIPEQGYSRLWPLLIFAAALAARLIYLLEIRSSPIFGYLTPDPMFYHRLAEKIAAGQAIGAEILFKAPLYPYFVGAIYAIFGQSLATPLVIQGLLGSLSCVLIYLLARQFYSHKIAVTAGLIAAFYGTLIAFDNELLPTTLALVLNLGSLWLLLKYEKRHRRRLLFLSGLLLGISAALHPDVLLFVPVMLYWLYMFVLHNNRVWRRELVYYLLGIALLLVPAAVRNAVVGGEVVPFGTYAGINLAIGNNERADGRTASLPTTSPEARRDYSDALELAAKESGKTLSMPGAGAFWFSRALNYIVSHPIKWVGLELRKLAYLVSGYETSNDRQIYFYAKQSHLLRFLFWDNIVSVPFGIILPFALLAPLAAQDGRKKQFLLYGYVLSYAVVILLFYVSARYRLMVAPLVIIWAAAGFWGLVTRYRRGDYIRFYRWLGVLLAAIVICNVVSHIPSLSARTTSDFEGHLFSGTAHYDAGNFAEAERELKIAVALNPGSAAALADLGNACLRQGKDSLAIDYYRRATRVAPDGEQPLRGLASLYKKKLKIKELNDLLVPIIKKDSPPAWALKEYAYVHVLLDASPEAAKLYERAFQADTTDYDAIFLAGESYLKANMLAEAEKAFLRYRSSVPNSIEAAANLGQVYARQNRLDEALRQLTSVVNAQPNHPAGYFNLASVYSQMREFAKADSMLDKAAALDPTFPGLSDLRGIIADERKAATGK